MNIHFLGTGTSTGVPQIGCKCKVCTSGNLKDRRLRSSVIITEGSTQILIDGGPDLRQQLIQANIDYLSGILITHEHYDHISGLDDVRPLGNAQVYGEKRVLQTIMQNMPYCFVEIKYPGVPLITLNEIGEKEFFIENIRIQPIRIMHGKLPILGFRIGDVAYLTDVKTIPEESVKQLQNLDVLVINALRINYHIAHLSLNEALEIAERIGAKETYFTHISHDLGFHEEVDRILPEHVQLAYDGLTLKI
jgi:phosphoribosyl 1,2-cyclic phosphate phosphodiesterase